MKIAPHTYATISAALRQMAAFQPDEPRWTDALRELREQFLLDLRADMSGDMLIDQSREPALIRRQAG